ncbi:MAG: FAD binding domain-containing protein [Candidatus Acidiferrales bacterium]
MKPPPFEYFVPTSVEETTTLLAEHGEEAKILAGGQSLVPLLNFRLVQPHTLIDINRLQVLSGIKESDSGIHVGALTRHREVENSALVKSKCPILAAAAGLIGHVAIRNRGTFGGSLAHADPAAEFPLVLTALEGKIFLTSSSGQRVIGATDFFLDYLTTDVRQGEIVVGAWVPSWPARTGWGFHEFTLQHGGFAVAAVAALGTFDREGLCTKARIALGNVASTPVRNPAAEQILLGTRFEADAIARAARASVTDLEPVGGYPASAEYRIGLAEVLTRRALEDVRLRVMQAID